MAKFKHPSRGGEESAPRMVNGPLANAESVQEAFEAPGSTQLTSAPYIQVVSLRQESPFAILAAAICASGIITREKATPENVATRAVDYAVAITAELERRGL